MKIVRKIKSIFRYYENISFSFVSNIFINYLNNKEKKVKIEKKDKKVVKKKKNNVKLLIKIINNISQIKIKMFK